MEKKIAEPRKGIIKSTNDDFIDADDNLKWFIAYEDDKDEHFKYISDGSIRHEEKKQTEKTIKCRSTY